MMVTSVFHKHLPIAVHVFNVKQSTNGSFLRVATLVVMGVVNAVTLVTTGLVIVITLVVIGRTRVNALVVVALVSVVALVVMRATGVVIGVVSLQTVCRAPLTRCVKVLKMIARWVSGFLAGT